VRLEGGSDANSVLCFLCSAVCPWTERSTYYARREAKDFPFPVFTKNNVLSSIRPHRVEPVACDEGFV